MSKDDKILLDLNEPPFPPPEHVVKAAVEAIRNANRYPRRSLYEEVRRLLAGYTGLEPRNVLVTAGGDDALRLIYEVLARDGDTAILTWPGFPSNRVFAAMRMMRVIDIAVVEDGDKWSLPLEKLLEEVKANKPRIISIENPHNPTGSLLLDRKTVTELLEVLPRDTVLVVDEAYYEYSGTTVADMVQDHPNLVVVRTMSKAFCMAGFRVGYILAHPETRKKLERVQPPFTLPLPSLAAAKAALEDPGYVREVVEYTAKERERLRTEIAKLPGFKPYRSWTNFILVRGPKGVDLHAYLLEKGIATRPVHELGKEYTRIAVGRTYENNAVVNALRELAKP